MFFTFKNIFDLLQINAAVDDIDMHMTPIDTFGLFESRGEMNRVKRRKKRYCVWERKRQTRLLHSPVL
jgi:hypothetical protein